MAVEKRKQIRAAILRELARRGKSQSWLARQLDWPAGMVCRALSDDYDMRTSTAEAMLRALGLKVKR